MINDNNHIELARATSDKHKRRFSKSMLEHKKDSLNVSSILHKDEDIFYGANEDDDHVNETPEGDGTTTFFASAGENQKNHIEINSKKHVDSIEIQNNNINGKENNTLYLNSNNKFYDPIYNKKRHELPAKKEKLNLNVWSVLKDALGKDLSKFCVPGNTT